MAGRGFDIGKLRRLERSGFCLAGHGLIPRARLQDSEPDCLSGRLAPRWLAPHALE
ncbi:hypothetical protein [Mobiluncus mulieris]|uniref:hypothetical protein n=1 Tax=Mobiluncus mulieris TaxID=2052 RepID=UPI0024326189|nr:hypothetical protein [Mobiluncus mulieris]